MKEVKIDSFEMKFDAEREREILHSLEILMLVAVIICLQENECRIAMDAFYNIL